MNYLIIRENSKTVKVLESGSYEILLDIRKEHDDYILAFADDIDTLFRVYGEYRPKGECKFTLGKAYNTYYYD